MKWTKSKAFEGVRWHKNRKGDRVYFIRHRPPDAKYFIDEKVGTSAEKITPKIAAEIRLELLKNQRLGQRPWTLKEKRRMARPKNLTVAEAFTMFFEKACTHRKPDGIKTDQGRIRNHVSPALGDKQFAELTHEDISTLLNGMKKNGFAQSTIYHIRSLLFSCWKWFAEQRPPLVNALQNPAAGADIRKSVKVNNAKTGYLSEEAAAALLEELKNTSADAYGMAIFGLYAGLRLGEICRLRLQDIDFKNKIINIWKSKSGKSRHVPLHHKIIEMLQDRRPGRPTDFIFTSRAGRPYAHVPHPFWRALKKLKINDNRPSREKITFHSLRHTHASWLVKAGAPLYAVAKLLGHSSIQMTERYSHLAPESIDVEAFLK